MGCVRCLSPGAPTATNGGGALPEMLSSRAVETKAIVKRKGQPVWLHLSTLTD